MTTPFSSSFASAAAGSNGAGNRREGNGTSDWARSRPNGATQTFRRPSANTTAQTRDMTPQNPSSVQSPGAYIPPHLNSNHPSNIAKNGVNGPTRYGKEQMLAMYQSQRDAGGMSRRLPQLLDENWLQETQGNGPVPPTPRGESAEQYPGPAVCWRDEPNPLPLGLQEMDEEERQLFTSSVNSPIKVSTAPKEGAGIAPIGTRKTSISNYPGGVGSRPGTRRRDTSDSFTANGPLSPTENKTFFRGESSAATPPPALIRRRTDFKDDPQSTAQKDLPPPKDEEEPQAPIGSLRRANGPLNAGLNPPSASPWSAGPGSSAFGSMGTFGSFTASAAPQTQDKSDQRPGFGSVRSGSRFKDLMAKSSTEDIPNANKDRSAFGALSQLAEEDSAGTAREALKTRPNRSETNPFEEAPNRSGSAALSAQDTANSIDQSNFGSIGRSQAGLNEASPANTNPYQSTDGARDDGLDATDSQAPFSATRRALFSDDGAPRSASGFPTYSTFANSPAAAAWGPNPGFSSGTPGRERTLGFNDSIFSPISADLQSPTAGIGSAGFGAFGSIGRNNRLGGMLPNGMDDAGRSDARNRGRLFGGAEGVSQRGDPFDPGFGRASAAFDDAAFARRDNDPASFNPLFPSVGENTAGPSGARESPPNDGRPTPGSSNDMPAVQQLKMVLPDRMRWVYCDPQGEQQGPWSGLEMHDWFKAGFFKAELLVKKLEDKNFIPLAQLVRQIGNSREPFLVPQIGIAHGEEPGETNAWPNAATPTAANHSQTPFSNNNNFPSFGTTLTADQQNALERRKQEEQYMMAQQKEHLANRMARQQGPGQPHNMHPLQHQASAHSLHTQPSYGSITSPSTGYHPMPLPPGAGPSMGAHAPIGQQPPQFGQEGQLPGLMDRLSFNQRGPPGAPGDIQQYQQVHADRQRLTRQPLDNRAHEEAFLGEQGRNGRLEEFQELRGTGRSGLIASFLPSVRNARPMNKATLPQSSQPSLTEQVQWTTAHQLEQPIQAPPLSISPLPAPAAQRNRQHVAESLVPEPRSQTQTPIETPASSVAPWADRTTEAPRGPSLREIQEAEAKKAAEQAAILDAARRAQAEQERMAEAAVVSPAPGLPSSATWATSSSPSTPTTTGAGSVWAKAPVKAGPTSTAPAKKTLAQIQKEEEARKQRQAAAAAAQAQAQNTSSPVSAVLGKKYSELASKAAPATPATATANSAWTTVGSGGGKAKAPPTILATPQSVPRTVSSSSVSTTKSRPALPATRGSTLGEKTKAHEEFVRWLKTQLGKGLNGGINVESFVQDLLMLPPEIEIIADSVYANSQTLDGRRIAEEFVRRRKNADKGIVEPIGPQIGLNGSADAKSAGGAGWSEVAKKGPEKAAQDVGGAQFKVVPSKKKGGAGGKR
ncbi:GYF domain-containing protein mpd2 [Cyphellophora attinorum]|uniref:GYF domain-containing protein mpd2 n=1 Tax=Cyphellophora attinorum TaxID=1664694 RepID=A0A0N1HBG4_9EURO|nr:GYF domain-containing protein mpd2 [Phialophora attinorum]KPI40662.1 GYF domain-containing protein mpd2 [Phialophora attinorum]